MQRAKSSILIIWVIVLLAAAMMASAADKDDYAPRIYEGWGSAKGNMLSNFWHGLNFFGKDPNVGPEDNADTYGWYNGTFFGLANWEKEICLTDLTSDVRQVRDLVQSSTESTEVYTTTITVSAKKSLSYNSSLYEVSWYIMPYVLGGSSNLKFRIYLKNNQLTEFIIGKNGSGSDSFVSASGGSSDYRPMYLARDYTKVVLEYKFGDNEDINTFEASVVLQGQGTPVEAPGAGGATTNPTAPGSTQPPGGSNPPPAGSCPSPVTPKVNEIKVHVHGRGYDATPIVTRNCDYCASINMGTMGGVPRCSCPARPDGHPERPACESQMMGGNPRWFCNGAEIRPSDNPYQASCSGNVKVCNADLSVCGVPGQ